MSGAKVKLFPGSTPSDGETEELDLRKMGWPATHRPSFACCSSKMASRAAAMSLVFGAATRVPSMASALVALAALAALSASPGLGGTIVEVPASCWQTEA